MRAMTVAVRARRVVGAVLLLAPMIGAAQEAREAEVRQAMARAYVAQRADESGSIPPGSMFRAWQEVTALPSANFAFADPGWRPVGPAGLYLAQGSFGGVFAGELKAGRVNTIAVHPSDGRTILIGSQGGIWRTTNGGHTWTPTSDGQCSSSIGAIAFDPVNPNLVYAATGDGRGAVQLGCGVIRSFDGGQTWTAPATTTMVDTWPLQLVIDRPSAGSTTGTTLYVATIQGLYVSNNSGVTWTRRLTGLVSSVVAHPTRPGVLFASAYRSGNVPASTLWRTADGGFTWTPMPTPLASTTVAARMTLVISPASPDRLVALAASYNNRRLLGVYRWDEVTQAWAALPTVGLVTAQNAYPFTWGEQGEYNQVLAIDPRDAARMWVAGVGAFASQDGGTSFQVAARNVHVDWHALALDPTDPDHLVAGTDGGVYQSFDGGRTWRSFNTGLAIAQIYPGLSVHPSGHWLFAGLQDNNAVYSTGSTIWNNLSYLGDGGYTAVNPNDPGTVYVTHAFLNFITRRATGSAEASRTTGILNGDRSGVPPVARRRASRSMSRAARPQET